MKIFSYIHNDTKGSACPPDWTTLPDSVMVRSGKPVFLPRVDEGYVIFPAISFLIERLGKHVEARFASRYLTGMAPAMRVMPAKAAEILTAGGRPPQSETTFDGALAVGDFISCDRLPDSASDLKVTLRALPARTRSEILASPAEAASEREALLTEFSACDMKIFPAEALCAVSEFNTVKTGDMLIMVSESWLPCRAGMEASASLLGEELLKIKVK